MFAREATRGDEVDRSVRQAFGEPAEGSVVVGRAVAGGWPVFLRPEMLAGHMAITGPSGAGKSYLAAGLARAFLGDGCVLLDPKQETVSLVARMILDRAREMPEADAQALLDRVVVVNLFSSGALPRFQVLAPIPGLDPELHAITIAHVVTTEQDQGVGARQEPLLCRTIECLIRAGLPLTVLPVALEDPRLLDALAERHAPADLFRTTAARLRKESKDRILGITSRVERVLRTRNAHLALGGAATCIDPTVIFDEGRIALVNAASPHGSPEAGRFFSGMFWSLIAHAVRRRPNGARTARVAIDEFPAVLTSGGAHLADSVEDVLRLARSKRIFLTALSQDMTSIAKASRTLPEVMKTNIHMHAVFRSSEASAWDFLLPVTGRRPRPASAPWESPSAGYLDRHAELALLREELAKLPDRQCFLVDRRTGLPGVRMRSVDLVLRATDADVHVLERRSSRAPEVADVSELEAGEREVRLRVEALLSGSSPPRASGASADALAHQPQQQGPRTRTGKKLDIG